MATIKHWGVRGLVRRVTAITPQMQEKEAAAISTERAPVNNGRMQYSG